MIKAHDSVAVISLSTLSHKISETGGLHSGARVMPTANVDVSDGLVNGARGEVVHVNSNGVLLKCDNDRFGLKSMQTSPHRSKFPHGVPLIKQV